MKRLIFLSLVILLLNKTNFAHAQEQVPFIFANDAVLLTKTQPIGSARIQALGGAQTALGGDISNVAGNPAGLGFFTKSEFTISPAYSGNSSVATFNPMGNTSRYANTQTRDYYGNLNVNNFGFVFSKAKDPIVPGKWRGFSFGITYNTLSNYNNRFSSYGTNDTTSITDSFVDNANGTPSGDLEGAYNDNNEYFNYEALAYSLYLIDPLQPGSDRYYSFNEKESVSQSEIITTKGTKSQWNFAFGGNYNDKLFFGGNLGIASFRYKEDRVYNEDVLTDRDNIDDLNNLSLKSTFDYKGSGINIGGGIIYRPINLIRIGASFQSPTYFYSVQLTENGDIEANYNNYQVSSNVTLNNEKGRLETTQNNYQFTTPWKFSGGVALFIGKMGFITADVDYLAYNTIRLSPKDDYLAFNTVNSEIATYLKPAVNIRIGGEYRYSIFRLRAGYALYGASSDNNQYASNTDNRQYLSLGAGVRLDKWYLDFGLINTVQNFYYRPYALNDNSEPTVQVKNPTTKGIFTLGFFF